MTAQVSPLYLYDNVSIVCQTYMAQNSRQCLDVLRCIRIHGILDVPDEQFAVTHCNVIRSARYNFGI
jgi:hypothetical protein